MAEHSDPPKTGDPSLQAPEEHPATTEAQHNPGLRDSTGWDGKLRMPKNALLANPEALSDPEYSDDDHVVPGEEISADEGTISTMTCSAVVFGLQIAQLLIDGNFQTYLRQSLLTLRSSF
jgi:hypothetical protein